MADDESLIPTHGGYRKLKSFRLGQLVYDVTVRFCDRYIDRRSRTHDQMVQAARSGVQNIAEGSMASGTSKKTELKLTNVARASLEELRLDYEDFLRQRKLSMWGRNDPRRQELIDRRFTTADEVAHWVKEMHERGRRGPDESTGRCGPNGRSGPGDSSMSTRSAESPSSTEGFGYAALAANAVLVLIHVTCVLLDRQLAAQAVSFENEGGFTERLYRRRTWSRSRQ